MKSKEKEIAYNRLYNSFNGANNYGIIKKFQEEGFLLI